MNAKLNLELATLIECAHSLQGLIGDIILHAQSEGVCEEKSKRMLTAVRHAANYLADQLENDLGNTMH